MPSFKIVCKNIKQDNTTTFYLRVTHNRESEFLNLDKYIHKDYWDFKKQVLLKSYPNYDNLDFHLNKVLLKAQDISIKLDNNFTFKRFKDEFNKNNKNYYFLQFYKEHLDGLKEANKIGDYNHHLINYNFFNKYLKGKDISFLDIDKFFVEGLKKECSKREISGLTYLRALRTIYNKAIYLNIVDKEKYPFGPAGVKIGKNKKKERYVEEEDLLKFINYTPTTFKEEFAKDCFMFMFLCIGMEFIDFCYLEKKNIVGNRLVYTRKKVPEDFTIKITDSIKYIINKYLTKERNYIFPVFYKKDTKEKMTKIYRLKNDLVNSWLKNICAKLEIKNITTKMAKHTWATLAKMNGVDMGLIQDSFKHKNIETTETYLGQSKQKKVDETNEKISTHLKII